MIYTKLNVGDRFNSKNNNRSFVIVEGYDDDRYYYKFLGASSEYSMPKQELLKQLNDLHHSWDLENNQKEEDYQTF